MLGQEREAVEIVNSLTVADHTHVIQDILENAVSAATTIAVWDPCPTCPSWLCGPTFPPTVPKGPGISYIVAHSDGIDGRSKDILGAVAFVATQLPFSIPQISDETRQSVIQTVLEIGKTDSQAELSEYLKSRLDSDYPTDESVLVGIRTAMAIVEDGKSTIYNPDFWGPAGTAVASKKDSKEDTKDLAKADVAGAIGGAAAGAAAAGVGAGPGALAGGITASTAKAVEKVVSDVIDWIWG